MVGKKMLSKRTDWWLYREGVGNWGAQVKGKKLVRLFDIWSGQQLCEYIHISKFIGLYTKFVHFIVCASVEFDLWDLELNNLWLESSFLEKLLKLSEIQFIYQ